MLMIDGSVSGDSFITHDRSICSPFGLAGAQDREKSINIFVMLRYDA